MPDIHPQCDDGNRACYHRVSRAGCQSEWNGESPTCPDRADYVVLVWYHDGFFPSAPRLVDVCDNERTAMSAIEHHKQARDQILEYAGYSRWWTEMRKVRSGNEQGGG